MKINLTHKRNYRFDIFAPDVELCKRKLMALVLDDLDEHVTCSSSHSRIFLEEFSEEFVCLFVFIRDY